MTTIDAQTLAKLLPPSFYDQQGQLRVTESEAQAVASGILARMENMPPAQAATFLALVKSGDLAPAGGTPSDYVANLSTNLDRLESISARIAELLGDNTGAMEFLIRAFIETVAEQRKEALESRLEARETAKGELLKQAGDMKEAAKKMMDGAITAIVFTVVMSALSLVGSAISFGKGLSQAKDIKGALKGLDGLEGDDLKTAHKALDALASKGATWGNVGTGAGTAGSLGQGISSSASSITQAQAKEIEAKGSISAAEAQNQQAVGDMKKEVQQSMDEMIKAIINFLKELRESEANHMQALTKV